MIRKVAQGREGRSLRPIAALGLSLTLLSMGGCGIVERSQQCGSLATVMRKNESRLAPSLPPDPSAEVLRDRASSLNSFSDDLTHVHLKLPELIKIRRAIVEQLSQITKRLDAAAESVVESREAQKSADLAKAEQDRERAENTARAPSNAKRRNNPASAFRTKQHQALRKYMQVRAEVDTATTETAQLMKKLEHICH